MSDQFRKYDHVERYGHPDVQNLDAGVVHVFPKLDGTNASVWIEEEPHGPLLQAASRTRTLSEGAENAGFWAWTREREADLVAFITRVGGTAHVYGEWLVPHTLKTYREEAWRRFYIFDVYVEGRGYLPPKEWVELAREFSLDVVDPLCIIENPTEAQLQHQVEMNTYLVADGAGAGEGIVLKNFAWRNVHGKQPWMKIVRNEFKEKNRRAFGAPEMDGAYEVEAAIAEEFVTPTLVAKCRAKILNDLMTEWIIEHGSIDEADWLVDARKCEEQNRAQIIPRLLQTVYTDLVREELYPIIKKLRDPTINFKRLRAQAIRFTKEYAADLF